MLKTIFLSLLCFFIAGCDMGPQLKPTKLTQVKIISTTKTKYGCTVGDYYTLERLDNHLRDTWCGNYGKVGDTFNLLLPTDGTFELRKD